MANRQFIDRLSLLQTYSHSWFDTSPRTEIQHVTAAKARSPCGIEACPELVEGGEKDFCKRLRLLLICSND
jgi:hypothetical protein